MAREFETIIHCQRGKHRYIATFEEKEPLKWYGVKSTPVKELSWIEKIKGKFSGSQSEAPTSLPKTSMDNIEGSFFIGNLCCPNCQSNSFVKCHKCGQLTCHVHGAPEFKCAVCGNQGKITGTVKSMSAKVNQKDANQQQNQQQYQQQYYGKKQQ